MGSKTKIMVFRMRELIYTGIFAAFLLILIVLLILMFRPKKTSTARSDTQYQTTTAASAGKYTAGVYAAPITLNDSVFDVEVTVDTNHINSIRLVNLSESVTTMYPLIQPALEEIAVQIYEKQSTEDITYSEESKYTSQILLNAVNDALATAEGNISSN